MQQQYFYFISIQFNQNTLKIINDINQAASNTFNCSGIEEFSIDEETLDENFGTEMYTSNRPEKNLIERVERLAANSSSLNYKYYFSDEDSGTQSQNFRKFLLERYPDLNLKLVKSDLLDWNQEWRKFYQPITISKKLKIVPEWLRAETENKNSIYIYPGMGFGTGSHETTWLCLSIFDGIIDTLPAKNSCLDFGCGSGILGIAAKKRGIKNILFCDIDTQALENCHQNLYLNFKSDNLGFAQVLTRAEIKGDLQHNLIFANILENVLILEKEFIVSTLQNSGFLIVSGILKDQISTIEEEYQVLKKIKIKERGDWAAILFQKEE